MNCFDEGIFHFLVMWAANSSLKENQRKSVTQDLNVNETCIKKRALQSDKHFITYK